MDVKFADTFFDSFKRMIRRERWYWKLYDSVRYDLPRFVKTTWRHRYDAWNSRPWDATGSLRFMKTHLELLADYLEKYGIEVEDSRFKKIKKIRRAIELIDHYLEDSYIDLAEQQLGKEVTTKFNFVPSDEEGMFELQTTDTEQEALDNKEIFNLARQLEKDEWFELFTILRGQNINDFKEIKDEKFEDGRNRWENWFDGSGMNTWWD